ncbi:hypothetical protein, partial [Paenibacillus sp. SI8]|uniref:hypothetical protein n=1 Tax=unclassified Paenibacillus TaxID=185978 RepID=UPI0034677C87
ACLSKRCLDRHPHHEAGESTDEAYAAVNKGRGEDQASRSMSVSSPRRGKERSPAGRAVVKSRLSLAAARTMVLNRSEGSKPLPTATETTHAGPYAHKRLAAVDSPSRELAPFKPNLTAEPVRLGFERLQAIPARNQLGGKPFIPA